MWGSSLSGSWGKARSYYPPGAEPGFQKERVKWQTDI